MTAKVKICGLRSIDALDAALDAGADFFGLVFYEPSPRNVDLETAGQLAAHGRGKARSVALLVDPDDDFVMRVVESVDPDMVQLHGSESPSRVAEIAALARRPVVKAVKVATRSDAEAAADYNACADVILYDAKAPEEVRDALPGGNGVPFDWRALTGIKKTDKFMLSGGLNPDNVRAAIELTGARIVDVSSGVESAPGVKDPDLIRRFVAAAKEAHEAGT